MAVVYKHTCKTSGKCYIGQTVKSMEARWAEHCSDANRNNRRKFFRAINKYGADDWIHEVLFESDNPELITDRELALIAEYDSVKSGYNTLADRCRKGAKHQPESIEKMRAAQRAAHARRRANGTEGGWKRKDGGPMKGKVHPNKGGTNPKNSANLKGRTWEDIHGIEGAAKMRAKIKETKRLTRLAKLKEEVR